MIMEHFDDETLMAFADGELDAATSQRLEEALETNEVLAKRLAVFLDTRMALGYAMRPLIEEPVPEALSNSIRRMVEASETKDVSARDDNVVILPTREKTAVHGGQRRWMPIAASILAVMTGVGGYVVGRAGVEAGTSPQGALSVALDTQLSGNQVSLGQSETLHIVSSFVDGQGELCREYELKTQNSVKAAISCRVSGTWVTRLMLSTPHADGYVPASSQETIDTYLASIEAGEPLASGAEQKALTGQAE